MISNNTKIVTIEENGLKKPFIVNKLGAYEFMRLTNKLINMLVTTTDVDANIVKQFIYNVLSTGQQIKNYDPAKVDETVINAAVNDWEGLLLSLVRIVFIDIEKHQDGILDILLSCIKYQNGADLIALNLIPKSTGYVNSWVEDGLNLYSLIFEAFKLNYSERIKEYMEKLKNPKQ